jgi:hypothetical protein
MEHGEHVGRVERALQRSFDVASQSLDIATQPLDMTVAFALQLALACRAS